jgi:dienelactone hydrolase
MGAPLDGVVSFHGGLKATIPAKLGAVTAPILSCVGTENPSIPPEDRNAFETEMKTADAKFHLEDGDHHGMLKVWSLKLKVNHPKVRDTSQASFRFTLVTE